MKEKKDEEMLVTHPPKAAEPDAAGRAPDPPMQTGLATASLEELQALLTAATRAGDRAAILEGIQRRFGNRAAEDTVSVARAAPGDAAAEEEEEEDG